jgi:para-aminobenzoate synthetase component 1
MRYPYMQLIMDKIREVAGEITGIHTETLDTKNTFNDLASRFARMPGTVLLMSGGGTDCAGHHILCARPWLSLSGFGRDMTISCGDTAIRYEGDPFDALSMIIKLYHLDDPGLDTPVGAGIFGYLSYDLKDYLETLPRTSMNDLSMPGICLFAPSIIIIHDLKTDTLRLFIPIRALSGKNFLDEDIRAFRTILQTETLPQKDLSCIHGLRSNFTMDDYTAAVNKVKRYILSGDVYQVNISQRFETDFSDDPFNLFLALFHENPAPFFAYINAGDHQVVSTSPERFLKLQGKEVETRPIKGTRPRGKTEHEDRSLRLELEQSQKDDAELSMIVDLLRNDLGKVCRPRSVHVAQHKMVESYRNVFHLVSIVKGTLDAGYNSVDLIKATFPGGSITGCPKIRAMEIIDEIEPNRRHIYTGSIGYISFHDTMDLSIAIRTATICHGKMIFSVGGGIVYDSDPQDEYNETLHKGMTIMKTLMAAKKETHIRETAWVNGAIRPLEQASLKITDLGFQYGYGFFETVRVNQGNPMHLEEHMARFNRTWETLFNHNTPDLSWREIIDQLLDENGLRQGIAAVKIIATRGSRAEPPYDHGIFVMARPYVPRFATKNISGLKLATYPYPRYSPLADYKSLNYLYYHLAGKWAAEQGADESLILNPDGTISETNSANILLIRGKKVIRPLSPHVLAGIMEEKVCGLLLSWGYNLIEEKVQPEDLFDADNVMITNSLIGALPVAAIDGKEMRSAPDLCKKIDYILL